MPYWTMPKTYEEQVQIFLSRELHHISRNNTSLNLPPFSHPNFPVSVIVIYALRSSTGAKEENSPGTFHRNSLPGGSLCICVNTTTQSQNRCIRWLGTLRPSPGPASILSAIACALGIGAAHRNEWQQIAMGVFYKVVLKSAHIFHWHWPYITKPKRKPLDWQILHAEYSCSLISS